jgi:hypothetical protein
VERGAGETFGGGAMVQAYTKHYGWHDCIVLLVMDNIAAICYWNRQRRCLRATSCAIIQAKSDDIGSF